MKFAPISLLSLIIAIAPCLALADIPLTQYGAVGDGATDDTAAVQQALEFCSDNNVTCTVPAGKTFRITAPLFLWGGANVLGTYPNGNAGILEFEGGSNIYLVLVGISAAGVMENVWTGEVKGVRLHIKSTSVNAGRLFFFFRSAGGRIIGNQLYGSDHGISLTGSGNNSEWLTPASNYVRKNLTVADNIVIASVTTPTISGEGIGFEHFDGVLVDSNYVNGVADDPIGCHFSSNVRIIDNELYSTDGRIYLGNCYDATIKGNYVSRVKDGTGTARVGVGLIYVGWESYSSAILEVAAAHAPKNVRIEHNTLYYPPYAVDLGNGIYLVSVRNTVVRDNLIFNDAIGLVATAIQLTPASPFTGGDWSDPDGLDTGQARTYEVEIINNQAIGAEPQQIGMNGECPAKYVGPIRVIENRAAETGTLWYCSAVVSDNVLDDAASGITPVADGVGLCSNYLGVGRECSHARIPYGFTVESMDRRIN